MFFNSAARSISGQPNGVRGTKGGKPLAQKRNEKQIVQKKFRITQEAQKISVNLPPENEKWK